MRTIYVQARGGCWQDVLGGAQQRPDHLPDSHHRPVLLHSPVRAPPHLWLQDPPPFLPG